MVAPGHASASKRSHAREKDPCRLLSAARSLCRDAYASADTVSVVDETHEKGGHAAGLGSCTAVAPMGLGYLTPDSQTQQAERTTGMRQKMPLHPSASLGVLAVVVFLVAVACTAGSPAATTTTLPPANRVDCSGVIGSYDNAPDPFFSLRVLDVIALEPGPLDLGREGEPGTPYEGLRFAKFGLIVRADRALILEIMDVQPGNAVMA